MGVLSNCEPKKVLEFFEMLCSVPHGSGNTKQISDLCVKFAKDRGLEYHQDALNNVIIIKEASAGYENEPALILQGHMDMVCEKVEGSTHDFMKDGLKLIVDGDWLHADGTTLGGDDCIALAMAMAALDDDTLSHPRLEAVFTVDEEVGMEGAFGIDCSPLKAKAMLNLDSEEEGVLTVGCAGGMRADCVIPVKRENITLSTAKITISGLIGGHSGAEIDKGRANSNILMGRVLHALEKAAPVRLVELYGGRADNVITNRTDAVIAFDSKDLAALSDAAAKMAASFKKEYNPADPDIAVSFEPDGEKELDAVSLDDTKRIICALMCTPQGVQEMSQKLKGLVQTSLNMGVLKLEKDRLTAGYSVRSSIGTQKEMLGERLSLLYGALGGGVSFRGAYPAWEYADNSPLRDKVAAIFEEQYGRKPEVVMTHGGLECGLFGEKIPGLDTVALGPDLIDIHSPKEKLNLPSLERTWNLVRAIIERK